MQEKQVKLKAGRYRVPVTLIYDGDRIAVKFKYNKLLIAEIKAMEGSKYHGYDDPTKKFWSIANSHRNAFQLAYLQGHDPYSRFDVEIIKHDYQRPLYEHQKEFSDFVLTVHQRIIAGEMGTGKTLAAIEIMERSGFPGTDWWYIAPKSGLKAVEREFRIWKSMVHPKMMTYEKLTKTMKEWTDGTKAPRGVFFDESARAKNPTAQRSQACKILADGIRDDYGDDGYIVLMSGAPAPRSPADWWHQCEIACPGFLKEGSQMKFKKRLAIIVEKESERAGGVYPHLEAWRDDEKKCNICGKYSGDEIHKTDVESVMTDGEKHHVFKQSKNEVAFLYERMKGLTLVKFKKDCLDLPEKQYRLIELKPSQKIINIAKSILSTATTTISGITLLRELSDGFQYQKVEDGTEICKICVGGGNIIDPLDNSARVVCDGCGGKGTRKKFKRIAEQIECPKEEALRDLLDEMNDVGRIVVYAGFTGSVDRCVQICQACNWSTIRVDGRGWQNSEGLEGDPLDIFQDQLDKYPRVAFIGQPGAAGMGLTLTASPVIVYYSNDFNFESRIQSEDRIHRPGMDKNRGATIIDFIHLPTDTLVLDNLLKKRKLQAMTLGEMAAVLK